jgi:WD40 repeat protein
MTSFDPVNYLNFISRQGKNWNSSQLLLHSCHEPGQRADRLDFEPIEERFLVSVGLDGRIAIYDTTTLPSANSAADRDPIYISSTPTISTNSDAQSLAPNPRATDISWCPWDRNMLSTCDTAGQVHIWDIRKANDKNRRDSPVAYTFSSIECPVTCLSFMKNSNSISGPVIIAGCISSPLKTSGSRNLIRICDLRSGASIQGVYLSTKQSYRTSTISVQNILESPQSNILIFSCSDGTVRSWDMRKGPMNLDLESDNACCPMFSLGSDSDHIIGMSASLDNLEYFYYTKEGYMGRFPRTNSDDKSLHLPYLLKFSSSTPLPLRSMCSITRDLVAVPDQNKILLVDMNNRHVLPNTSCIAATLDQHWDQISCIKWAPQTMSLYSVGQDNRILKWQVGSF